MALSAPGSREVDHMSLRPLYLVDVLSRFDIKNTSTLTELVCRKSLSLIRRGRLLEAFNQAQAGLRDAAKDNDRHTHAIACALLAAVYASQENFAEAVRYAEDSRQLFRLMGSAHNATVARTLLAVIYRMNIDMLSRELIETLQDSRDEMQDLENKALSKGASQTELAMRYHQQFVEFGDAARRARWIPAIPYALPLVWLPIISSISSGPHTQGAEPEGYMEPVLFALKSKQDVERENQLQVDPGQITDQLYTARPLPGEHQSESSILRPPRLKPIAQYVAIKVDPDSARMAGLEPDDYLLVRSLSLEERAELLKQADANAGGFYFRMAANGVVEIVRAVPPKFVAEEDIRMFVAQIDAVLRRVL